MRHFLLILLSFSTIFCLKNRNKIDKLKSSEERGIGEYLRSKRQTIYYLCGSFPNQFLSLTPCNNNCNTCNSCQYQCSTSSYCQQFNRNWRCLNNCCRTPYYNPQPTLPPSTPSPNPGVQPVCGGRETSGGYCRSGNVCGSGYMCNDYNICCRCSYGTSIGPCVNQQCPDNTYCSPTNNCCPYLVK